MVNGPGVGDGPPIGFAPSRIEIAKPSQNFTPLPEFERPTMTEPPKYEKPTDTVEVDKLMAQIMNQKVPKNPQEVVSQIEKKIPQEVKKSQGFIAQIIEWFKTTFRNLFR